MEIKEALAHPPTAVSSFCPPLSCKLSYKSFRNIMAEMLEISFPVHVLGGKQ